MLRSDHFPGETALIVVHHLNESRSQRILWLLEELGVPYEIAFHQRNAETRLAPPELVAVHPLGKSPVIVDDGQVVHESGAIIDYIVRRHGGGRMAPKPGTNAHETYLQWLHYAEGSAMLPLMLAMYVMRLGEAGAPLQPRIESEIANHMSYIEGALAGRDYLLGAEPTGADVQMSFVPEVLKAFGKLGDYPNMTAWIDRIHARPAWAAALEKSGPYALGR